MEKKEVATVRKDDAGTAKQAESSIEAINDNRDGCRFPLAMTDEEVTSANKALKEELWARGYYVLEVGGTRFGETDYLIVSASLPKKFD